MMKKFCVRRDSHCEDTHDDAEPELDTGLVVVGLQQDEELETELRRGLRQALDVLALSVVVGEYLVVTADCPQINHQADQWREEEQ